ncbi:MULTISPECIES: lysylphosphatidylglycerol synthase transmembrane domain-containing protein [unclassified Lentimicrobium]|uniref:lysylphosphatidylglycerol synthase transmembrane domain-containing protein n=1 Tax=unclassified Lentimicrobium TaxID=2677434 RepID=UPI0015521657|nr:MULTISPECIES: lysylphosphatidylglycerol synthase transmembrane domain-containing protein [unclassified Lentimicrobium]NPD46931.1 flippase-like domain-containing protein [Lentimicrobium sp. S6]NPD84135.1 flippase-like domain-containing protein [Lentimicrobium sp. L6]
MFLVLGIVLLYLAFRNINIEDIWSELKKADYSWLIYSMFLALASHFFRALRWNQLINSVGYQTKASTTFYAVMTGYLANLALPRMGEVSRCVVLSKKDNIPFNTLFGTVITERVFDMIVLLLIIAGIVLFQINLIGGFINKVIISPMMGSYAGDLNAILILSGIIIIIIGVGVLIFRKLRPYFKTTMLYSKIEAFLNGIWSGMKSIAKLENKMIFLFNTFMIWLLYLGMIILPFYSFEETSLLNIIDGFTVLAIGSLGIVAPTPGGIGSYHFIVTELFTQLYDIPSYAAAAYATANHAAQTLIILLAGGVSYVLLLLNKRKPLNDLPKQNKK